MTRIRDQLYRPEYAIELIEIATGDLESAVVLSQSQLGRRENICFLSQQVIEKSLKAVLCSAGKNIPHTHDLLIIADRLLHVHKVPEEYDIALLNDFAAIRRYERGFVDLDAEDIAMVLKSADHILNWAISIVKP